jgi:hypothetical protein
MQRLLCLILLPLALPACDSSAQMPTTQRMDVSPACMEATMHSDLAFIEKQIFTPSCANFSACHQGAATAADSLNLEMGRSQASLVGKPAIIPTRLGKPMNLVTPGDPDNSYLVVILDGTPTNLIDPRVGTMPFQQNTLLCPEKRDAIRRWIQSL